MTAAKIVRTSPDTSRRPGLAISAKARLLEIEKALKAGFVCYSTKPIKVNEFIEALDVILDPS